MSFEIINIARILVLMVALVFSSNHVLAGSRFNSRTISQDNISTIHSCNDGAKDCIDSGFKTIEGESVYRSCWRYSYSKSCNYPSKDDCKNYTHCYGLGDQDCLLRDAYGACVNILREFSCKRWEPVRINKETVSTDLKAREGQKGFMCKGIPCIDGNCVDQSYQTNGEMMDSISKLYAVSKMNIKGDINFQLFAGSAQHCSKKAGGYSNCCSVGGKGWGERVGAGCSADEKLLMEQRSKNLCVYVGKQDKQNVGIKTIVKHHYCCFGSILDKVIQEQGRAQLSGRASGNFGSGGRPNCNGLTLAELEKINFDQLDFSEFIEDFKVKFFGKNRSLNTGDIASRVEGSLSSLKKGDENPNNKGNNFSGWSTKPGSDMSAVEEEERLELANQRRAEELRLSEERRIERERLEELRRPRRIIKEKELEKLRNQITTGHSRCGSECRGKVQLLQQIQVIEQDLNNGNY